MLDNPLSRIERTKDAYMGRPQELQKRANMTKELVDLLAMQQLKKDLDAVKRNQAMQAQGNPATIKEQMQQGLMGEYRQQAAKEMGVGPSEADTVARAQQGMPQGMPQQQMAQRPQMPQAGAQQMAQGVMSQAQPVKLAGGGIVAFQEGMRVGAPEEAGFFSQFSLPDMDAVRRAEERRKAERARAIAAGGDYPENITVEEAVEAVNEALAEPSVKARRRKEAAQAKADEEFELPSEDLAMLDEAMRPARRPKVGPPAEAQTDAGIASAGGVDGSDAPLSLRDRQQRALDAITSMAEVEPYQRDQDLTAMLKKQMARDPSAEGIAAIERIKELSGLEESRRMLEAQRSRLREDYESATPSGTARFMDLISTPGGLRTIGRRGAQMRRQEAERRQEFTAGLADIDNTAMELQRSVGTSAASNYETAAKTAQGAISSAAATLQQADAAGRSDYVERVKLKMSSKQSLMSHLESLSNAEQAAARAALDREQITSNSALGVLRASETSINQASERMRRREEDIKGKYTMSLGLAQNDPVKLAEITETIKEEVTLANASDLALIQAADNRLQEASKVLSKQGALMAGAEEVSGSADFDTYKNK